MIVVQCDGASKGNPGPAQYTCAIWFRLKGSNQRRSRPTKILHKDIGRKTNHEAEWEAIIAALLYVNANNDNEEDVYIYNDSTTVVNIALGKFKCKNVSMETYKQKFIGLGGQKPHIHLSWVPRQMLLLADKYNRRVS